MLAAAHTLANHADNRNRRTRPMNTPAPAERVVLVDLRIPFFRLVFFLVKVSLAAIPAAIILGAILMVVSAAIAAFLGGGDLDFLRRWKL
jgi:hypothetical protein